MEELGINLSGLAIGLSTFLIIGIFHPFVIKGEYYFGQKISIVFLLSGIAAITVALLCRSMFLSGVLAVTGFSCFWSILEVRHQRRRVIKGWFPMNPKRANEYPSFVAEYPINQKENKEKKKERAFHNGHSSLTNISITEET